MASKVQRRRRRAARKKAVALPPGTAVYTGHSVCDGAVLRVIDYGPDHAEALSLDDVAALEALPDPVGVRWVSVRGLSDVALVQRVCARYGVHPLVVEDIVAVDNRSKAEEYPDHLFIVAKRLMRGEAGVEAEHVSMVVGGRVVITFEERPEDTFASIAHRLAEGKRRLHASGADYLAYALLDVIVDHGFEVLDAVAESIEALEEELLTTPSDAHLERIYAIRRDLMEMRRHLWPMRETVAVLLRSDDARFHANTRPYLRDLNDHVLRAIDAVESYRDVVMGLLELHMTQVSMRLNEAMRVLTVVGTVFIPLTFIAGVYGMNFQHMPELGWRWGYPAVWGLMIALAAAMLWGFRRRGWI